MTRIAIVLGILGLLACGGQESDLPDVASEAKEAVGGAMDEAAGAMKDAAGAAEEATRSFQQDADAAAAGTNPQVTSCLDLVSQGRYSEAVAPCMAALRIDPDNNEVQEALETAKAKAAEASAAAAAAQESAEQAKQDAAGRAADALDQQADRLRQME